MERGPNSADIRSSRHLCKLAVNVVTKYWYLLVLSVDPGANLLSAAYGDLVVSLTRLHLGRRVSGPNLVESDCPKENSQTLDEVSTCKSRLKTVAQREVWAALARGVKRAKKIHVIILLVSFMCLHAIKAALQPACTYRRHGRL